MLAEYLPWAVATLSVATAVVLALMWRAAAERAEQLAHYLREESEAAEGYRLDAIAAREQLVRRFALLERRALFDEERARYARLRGCHERVLEALGGRAAS